MSRQMSTDGRERALAIYYWGARVKAGACGQSIRASTFASKLIVRLHQIERYTLPEHAGAKQ